MRDCYSAHPKRLSVRLVTIVTCKEVQADDMRFTHCGRAYSIAGSGC